MSARVTLVHPAPRERLLASGAAALSDAELVALFLVTGAAGQSCLQLSEWLLRRVGSLRELLLLQASPALRLPGLGPARYARLQSALELARRVQRAPGVSAQSATAKVRTQLASVLTDLRVQSFAVAFLSANDECISCERLFNGTLRFVLVHPREVVRRALSLNAAGVSVARSDPEGSPQAAEADYALRTQLSGALSLFGVALQDFLIVGQSGESLVLQPACVAGHGTAPATENDPFGAAAVAGARSGRSLASTLSRPQQLALDLYFPSAAHRLQ